LIIIILRKLELAVTCRQAFSEEGDDVTARIQQGQNESGDLD
jgi:hypothetical protein